MALSTSDIIFWNDVQDGSGSTVTDQGSNGYNGTITGATWVGSGGPTNLPVYLDFNGNDKVTWSRITQTENVSTLTISVWVYFSNTTNDMMLWGQPDIGGANSIQSYWENNPNPDELFFAIKSINNRAILTAATLSASTWYHFAIVFDGTQTGNSNRLKIYVNGTLATPSYVGTIETTTQNGTSQFVFGERVGGTFDFLGRLGQIAILNKAIDTTELAAIYNSGAGATYADLFSAVAPKNPLFFGSGL